MKVKRALVCICMSVVLTGVLAGCSDATKVVFTTGFKKNEVFQIGDASCTLPEIMVYLTNMQNRYENVYGEEIWNAKGSSKSLEEEIKEQVLAQLAQIKAMNLLAEEKGIVLEEKDEERVAASARDYYASLNETERKLLDVDEKLITQMYREYAMAASVYEQIVENVNPEISDDEARTITVLAIRTETEEEARAVLLKALEEGADFEALADTYSEDTAISYSFGKGEMEEPIEKAAFDLGKNEISNCIKASNGWYVLKCTSTFDEAQTQANKEKIADERRNEAFNTEYNAFVDSLVRRLNEELWTNVTMIQDENVTTDSFFEIYNQYFQVE
ncbi:MAG: peptidyl-prolyl cis-trans isomerase [Lachnospiraceae bacterium]|nr:peptidyl-prolyl cis-trans isomerase [Lachnospiraceae bacterium]